MGLQELAVDPDSFMEQKVKEVRLRREILLLFLLGGLGSAGPLYASFAAILPAFGDEGPLVAQLTGFILRPLIGIFGVWIGYAVVARYLANWGFRGQGTLKELFKGTAWALVPVGIGNLVKSLGIYLGFRDAVFDTARLEVGFQGNFQEILAVGMDTPEVIAANVVLVVTILYSGYLLSFAVKHAENISERDARITAAVPAGVFGLLVISRLV